MLLIKSSSLNHKGVYTFIASNQYGQATCNIDLDVQGRV